MNDKLAGTSVWSCLFAGAMLLGAAATAGTVTVPVPVAAALGAVTGNIASAKIQAMWDQYTRHRQTVQAPGARPDSNHDEARAIRKAQLSAVRALAHARQPPLKLFGDNGLYECFGRLAKWAGEAMDSVDTDLEQKLREAAQGATAALTGRWRPEASVDLATELRRTAVEAVWNEVAAALNVKGFQDENTLAIRAAIFDDGPEGWFEIFSRQWHAELKTNARVSEIATQMYLAMIEEKLDALASGIAAIPEATAVAVITKLRAEGMIGQAQARGLSEAQVIGVLAAFGKNGLPAEHWADALLDSAMKLKDMEARLSALSNNEPEIAALLQAAGAAIASGDFPGADEKLAEAEQRDIAAGQARLRSAAESRVKRAELAKDLRQFWAAAEHYEVAARLIAPHDHVKAAELRLSAGYAFYLHGELFPGPGLARAVVAYRHALQVYSKAEGLAQWANVQNLLGCALIAQGLRAPGAESLKLLAEAVTAFQNNLDVYTQVDAPTYWAITQNNLGAALAAQGLRADGVGAAKLMGGAVTAYRKALEVYTMAEARADWARTQNNLANALQQLGERTKGTEGDRLLREAVTACHDALEVYNQAEMPAEWAKTQNNLGIALACLGARASGAEGVRLFDEAVAAYRNVLEVRSQDEAPADWTVTQMNLARAWLLRFKLSGDNADISAARAAAATAMTSCRKGGMEFCENECAVLLAEIAAAERRDGA